MIGLTNLEVYISIFNITGGNKKVELCKEISDEFSVTELKDELEEAVGISDFSTEHLQDQKVGLRIFKA